MGLINRLMDLIAPPFLLIALFFFLPPFYLYKLINSFLSSRFPEDMANKVVLIVGASSGIGEATYEYAKRGANMVLVARREQALRNVAKVALDIGAPDVLVVPADISDPEAAKRVIEETISHFGKLNHLVCNAGIWSSCLFEEITNITAFTEVMDVNFWGAVYPTYYALPYLRASHGNIVVNSSVAGQVPIARSSFYNASKAAVISFYESVRAEFGKDIKVTILTPGFVESELTKGKALQKGGDICVNEEARDVQVGPIPVGKAERLAKLAVDGACRGEKYLTWPSFYRPFRLVACLAPEVISFVSHIMYINNQSKWILEAIGGKKFLYPASIRNPNIKKEEL
ncbi:11-beta-hydroxysteroid dehydrogenase 1B-like protein [Carex littledalei]|uniref:11-beta-hydroxysteroid dehydrogenase 1B-like protein n=1 Tax=Carex littledalei TaxID=544730 RepID=A0A833V308_9POAL|nr:11-beta-hydroxysteroid dehydrogenase 1B-like protein [Carex littledalei]